MKYPLFKVFMSKNVLKPVNNVLMSGYITQGKQVELFEKSLKKFFTNDNVITVNSATSGLTLALRLLKKSTSKWPGFTYNDEVLSCPLTCTATNWSILANNMKVKWVDVDLNTANMCLDDLEKKISSTTKIIMLVHWGGHTVDFNRLEKILDNAEKKFGFRPAVIEDCAHAFGTTVNDKMLGNHNHICVFSFQAIKHLTTVDGGCLILPSKELYDRAKLLRWYGISREKKQNNSGDFRMENNVPEWGYKFHMNDVNATIGLHNLPNVPTLIKKHRRNASFYSKKLKNIDGVKILQTNKTCNSSYWIYTICVKDKQNFINKMKEHGIMVSQVHKRNDNHTCIIKYKSDLPNLDKIETELVCIPCGWWLKLKDCQYIVDCIKNFFKT